MQKIKRLIRYQTFDTFAKTPAGAGRAEKVVRCVANLVKRETVEEIIFNNSHILHQRGEGYTYEVKLVRSGRSKKRRFTVYRLSGMNAKSECYQVTDPNGKYIVVKIPPQPITEMNDYLDAVVYERSLAHKLAGLGIRVVVPSISSAMRHLHRFPARKNMTASETETSYIRLLRSSPATFIDKLKIDGSFVFFMDYVDGPFLGDIVRDIHHQERLVDLKKDLVEKDFTLICTYNRNGFLSEYKNIGVKKVVDEIYNELLQCYQTFTVKLIALFQKFALSFDQAEKRRDLFVANVLGLPIDESSFLKNGQFNTLDKETILAEMGNLLDRSSSGSVPLSRYLEVLDREAHWLAFKHNSRNIRKVGDNLLVLLTKLEEMGLVLRDLKVDNLFIANADNMELGVIDLETGGDTGSGNLAGIAPAGMPGNMTVSNLLFIDQLQKIYGSDKAGTILHLQDWYATVATMFETVTGKTLFDDARDYIIQVNNEIEAKATSCFYEYTQNNPGKEADAELIESFLTLPDEKIQGHTWNFFALAKRDLKEKSLEQSDRLKGIQFTLPESLKSKIIGIIENKLTALLPEYGRYTLTDITGDTLDPAKSKITVLRKNFALKKQLYLACKANSSGETALLSGLRIELDAFHACVRLKQREQVLIKKRLILEKKLVSAFALFPIMLDVVIEAMCRDEWQAYRPTLTNQPLEMGGESDYKADTIAGWKTRVAPNKEELAEWAKRSRNCWPKDRGVDDTSNSKTIIKPSPLDH